MSRNHYPNTVFLTPSEVLRIRTTLKTRLQKYQALTGQPRIPSNLQSQITTAALLSDIPQQPAPFTNSNSMVTIPIPSPFPPSTLPLSHLKPMTLSELRIAMHHHGRVLKVRRIADVVKLTSCSWTVVQDEDGEMERLEIGLHKQRDGREVLESKRFCVKEPWFTLSETGEGVLRVEHPSDVLCLDNEIPDSRSPSHSCFKREEECEVENTAREAKEQGNAALRQRFLRLAHAKYTLGLKLLSTKETDLVKDLFRNRAHVNLLLDRLDEARDDALSSLTNLTDQRHKELDSKAYFRAGHAAYSLGEFQSAKLFFEEQMRLAPSDKEAAAWIRNIEVRIKEQENGVYDFRKLKVGSLLLKARPRINAASFTRSVEVRESPGRGRGLFVTQDVNAGEVIMVEKAFCLVWGNEDEALTALTYDSRDDRIRVFPAGLWKAVVQKLLNNPSQVERFMNLYGDYAGVGKQAIMRDDGAVIDTFQVYDIVARNAFGAGPVYGDEDSRNTDTGLWITASYMNHSCIPNSKKEYIGDLMVVRATRAISAGEEITHSYDESSDFDARAEALMKTWGFICSCALCVAEEEDGAAVRKKRLELENEANALVERDDAVRAKRVGILRARRLVKSISDTYDDKRYSGLPRMALLRLQKWLVEATTR